MALSEEQKREAKRKEDYVLSHFYSETVREMSENLGCSISTTHKVISRLSLSSSNDINYNRTYNDHPVEDSNWFYFVGLMLADGSINNRGWQINLRDRQILDDISEWLGFKKSGVKEYKEGRNSKSSNKRYNLTARSKYFVDRLRYYGLAERKTGSEDYRNIPDEYYSDFIRGFMDGDGNISQGSIRLYSNEHLINKISKDLNRLYGYNCGINYHRSTIYCLRIRVKDSKDLTLRMYSNPHLSLKRKEVILCQKYMQV